MEKRIYYQIKYLFATCMVLIIALLTGCATTVSVVPEKYDIAAEKFTPPPNKANIYVVREAAFVGSAIPFKISLDGRYIGSVGAGTYLFFKVE